MRRILFATFGSYGDLFPYLAIGRRLQGRGHRVTIATSASFRQKVEEAGLSFHPVRPDVSLDDSELLAYIFDARHGSERVVRMVSSVVRESYEDTLKAAENVDTIVTHPITFAAVLVARKLQMPWVSSVLAPTSFFSAYDPPVLALAPWLTKLWPFGRTLLAALFKAARKAAIPWVKPVLQLSEEIGLGLPQNPLFEGSHSPELVLALYSKVLGVPQPDWPPNVLQTGFPFHEQSASQHLSPELLEFFNTGKPPVVFTLGSSAVSAAGSFYRESLDCAVKLGARALFLTGAQSHGLPASMPEGTLRWPYAPHRQVFSRAAAIVHQGGVGTTAEALRCGRPMLVVPFAHDQFDNAERVKHLGCGDALYRSRYSAKEAERRLRSLLEDGNYRRSADLVSKTILAEDGASVAADAIEALR